MLKQNQKFYIGLHMKKFGRFIVNCVVLFLFTSVTTIASAQNRSTPDCLNEQLTMLAFQGALANPGVATGAVGPPGTYNSSGPFGDPLFSAAGWEKREWTQYFRESFRNSPGAQMTVQRYTVQIHYMWNYNTRVAAQIKFKTTSQQGCVGVTVPLPNSPPGSSSSGEQVPSTASLTPGFSSSYVGTTHFRDSSVSVGPLVAVGDPSLSWGGGGINGGGGIGGGGCGTVGKFCAPRLLETVQPPTND